MIFVFALVHFTSYFLILSVFLLVYPRAATASASRRADCGDQDAPRCTRGLYCSIFRVQSLQYDFNIPYVCFGLISSLQATERQAALLLREREMRAAQCEKALKSAQAKQRAVLEVRTIFALACGVLYFLILARILHLIPAVSLFFSDWRASEGRSGALPPARRLARGDD